MGLVTDQHEGCIGEAIRFVSALWGHHSFLGCPNIDRSHKYVISRTLRDAVRENDGLCVRKIKLKWNADIGFRLGKYFL